jgi:hypothetical protein
MEALNQYKEKDRTADRILNRVYLDELNRMALEKSNEEVFSSDELGSTISLLRVLFRNYNKSAKIIGTSLCSKILGDEECRRKLDMFEFPINIILTNSPNYISDKVKNYFLNNLINNAHIKEIKGYVTQDGRIESDFLILDDTAYFLEITSKKVARCSFNNPLGALNLSKSFDEIYSKY